MITILKRVWKDISQGENIDLYVTVIVAIVLVILNIAGVAPPSWLGSITLGVLALLAITSLGNRYRLDQAVERLTQYPLASSGIEVYDHWNVREVYDVICSAGESIVIIETWIAEASTLSSYIQVMFSNASRAE